MEIKNVKQTKVFGRVVKTNLKNIYNQVKVVPEQVYFEMNKKGFQSEGPQVWIYYGADGNPETEFDLLVGYPVADELMDNSITALGQFKCVTALHSGDWARFKESYDKLIDEVMNKGMQMTGECREVYHQVDFENVENNLTEIQVGIK